MSRTSPRLGRVLLGPAVALAVALGVVVLPSSAARAEPTLATAITVALSRDFGVFYDSLGPAIPEDTFTVRGKLRSEGAAVPDQTVTLYRRLTTSTGDFEPVGTDVTGPDGAYLFHRRVVGGADYRVSYEGDGSTYLRSDSPTRTLTAVRDFNASTRKVDGKLFFRGTIRPDWGGRTVTLQKKRCGTCAWRTVASRSAGSRGAWSFRVYYPRKVGPVWRWQAVLAAAGSFERSFSSELTTRRAYTRR